MKARCLVLVAFLLVLSGVVGCNQPPPPPKQSHWLQRAPSGWLAKGGTTQARQVQAAEKPKPVAYKPDKEIVHPILGVQGNWTVRLAFYSPNPKKRLTALHYANNHCRALRKQGYEGYVTDFIVKAIVSIGSFDDPRDPELERIWREAYEGWLKLHGGRKSAFRRTFEQWYAGKTVFGDHPRPISIIRLQMEMMSAYQMKPTAEQKARYKKYLDDQQKKMYGYDLYGY